MPTENYTPISIIEDWWRHNGCYDREQASGIANYENFVEDYLIKTDIWWEGLTNEQKQEVYEDFFDEN